MLEVHRYTVLTEISLAFRLERWISISIDLCLEPSGGDFLLASHVSCSLAPKL